MLAKKSAAVQPQNKTDPIYYIIFDDYLKPKKTQEFSQFNGVHSQDVDLKSSIRERWRLLKEKQTMKRVLKVKPVNSVKANNCRPKTDFEIYCEVTSLHGFSNFLGASTWQRIFWYFILCVMIVMSITLLMQSVNLNADDPTILYVETTTATVWGSSFPAVALCNFNRISEKNLNELLNKDFSPEAAEQLRPHVRSFLYSTLPVDAKSTDHRLMQTILNNENYTVYEFLRKISPDCESQLLRCKLHGQIRRCNRLFQRVPTQHGFCCLFNYEAVINKYKSKENLKKHTNMYGQKWGLTVLIDPQADDYYASEHKLAGYEIFALAPFEYVALNSQHQKAFVRDNIHIHLTPLVTYATKYVGGYALKQRRCYMPDEYKLITFSKYTQTNCFAECRSKKMLQLCGCVPPLWPRAANWAICTLTNASCVVANADKFTEMLLNSSMDYKTNPNAEEYICDCYPRCSFTRYKTQFDTITLDRNYSMNELEFYRGIELKDHIVVHLFYANMSGDRFRLDVYNSWLTYFGIFGGITSLYMGYSFISGFEIIFFIFVRPMCNWLTRRTNQHQTEQKRNNIGRRNNKI
ncbi:pickpocket protein 11-like [Anastrepha obliqua]|uniref:pickpocket protein 11-like n=1 Tax=Anastrepha obliqua TaxID=95512 RepID=UPI002409A773|nr:pickpocket protein 11-like [Anastrepha obliqua]